MENIDNIAYNLGTKAKMNQVQHGQRVFNPYRVQTNKWHSWNKGFNDHQGFEIEQ